MARASVARRVALIVWLVAAAVLGIAGGVLAAGPSASPPAPACPDQDVVWFDQPVPADARPGQQLRIGMTIWDCLGIGLAQLNSAEIHVHPKTGKGTPAVFPGRSDWPGHLVATIEVPKAGVGTIEVGATGQVCHDDGTCTDAFFPFGAGGFGPPPDAPLSVLVNARISPGTDQLVAGHLFDVTVDVGPKSDWGSAGLPWPDQMVIEAQVVRGDTSYRSDARSATGTGGAYTGQLTVPDAGDYVLHAGFPGLDGGPDQMIDGAVTRITIGSGDGTTETLPPASGIAGAQADGSSVPILPIAAGVVALGALALVVRRVFADL